MTFNYTMSLTTVYELNKRFKKGKVDLEDNNRPKTSINDDNIKQVMMMMMLSYHLTQVLGLKCVKENKVNIAQELLIEFNNHSEFSNR